MRRAVLILSSTQFGYLTDTLKYCEYAADEFDITYIGWDYSRKRIDIAGVEVKYISRDSNIVARNIRLLKAFHKEAKKDYDVVFANYKFGISIIKILNRKTNFILDIRTLCVKSSWIYRVVYDSFLKFETLFFKNISVISDGLAHKLKLKNHYLLPLGGECFTSKSKSFEKLSFLYVGSFDNRNIIDCVKGFHLYIKGFEFLKSAPVFTIIGGSPGKELAEMQAYIRENCIEENIILVGEVPHTELHPFFERANIGISYIPMRRYYEHQPSTKTYEYLLSGLPVIGTSTFENKKVIRDSAGVLIADNAQSFLNGIYRVSEIKGSFNSDDIRNTHAEFSWERVVNEKFISLINKWSDGSLRF